jgi:malate dehydrogenase (quinone)
MTQTDNKTAAGRGGKPFTRRKFLQPLSVPQPHGADTVLFGSQYRAAKADRKVDVLLIGGGIMSATLGVYLKELEPNWT